MEIQESCTETVTVYKPTDNRGFRAVNGDDISMESAAILTVTGLSVAVDVGG